MPTLATIPEADRRRDAQATADPRLAWEPPIVERIDTPLEVTMYVARRP